MISARLLTQIEGGADRLTNDLIKVLQSDARCEAYRTLDRERLLELKDDLFKHMRRWLSERSRSAVESRYIKLGRERYLESIPLSQVVFALNLTKAALLDFMRCAMTGKGEELALEYELALSISEFFDQALYSVAVGYEDAVRAQLIPHAKAAEMVAPKPDHQRAKRAAAETGEETELFVSRSGQVGEASG